MSLEKNLEDLKKQLFRLHFLVTEKQTTESILEVNNQFIKCYKLVMNSLAVFLKEEYHIQTNSDKDILIKAFENHHISQETKDSLMNMKKDYKNLLEDKGNVQLYEKVKLQNARMLQLVFDLLNRMGEEPPEEEG